MAGQIPTAVRQGATVIGVAVVVATPFATHITLATGRFAAAAAGLACAQAVLLLAVSWRARGWRRGVAGLSGCGLLVLLAARVFGSQVLGKAGLVASAGTVHAMLYLSLLVLFGQSLRPGRTPLVTSLALRMRGVLSPVMRRYTRAVTVAWCGFFLGQLLLSALLLAFAPQRVWSLAVNVLDGPMVVAMFLVEYGIRRWRFRDAGGHASPLAVARAFARRQADG